MKKYLLLFFIFLSYSLKAQESVYLYGFIKDSIDQSKIPLAHIRIQNKAAGGVSDYDGKFQFSLPKVSSKDSLVISCVGYQSKTFSFKQILEMPMPQTFYLSPENTLLDTVKVRSQYKITDLILEALEAVNQNYYEEKTIYLEGFFKAYIDRQVNNKMLENVKEVEAIITTIRPKMNGLAKARPIIRKARYKRKAFEMLPTYRVYYVFLDLLEKDLLPSFMKEKWFDYYHYQLVGIVPQSASNCYHLRVRSKNQESSFQANIYIDSSSLAITKLDMSKSYEGNLKPKKATGLYKLLMNDLYETYSVTYRQENQKWYLDKVESYLRVVEKDSKDTLHNYLKFEVVNINREKPSLKGDYMSEKTSIEKHAIHWDDPAWREE